MTNCAMPLDAYQDVETKNMIDARRKKGYSDAELLRSAYAKSRDNARTPMQWSAAANAGFTTGTPWLAVNENYREINAEEALGRADSVFACYQTLIRLRKQYPVFTEGTFRLLLPEDEAIFAYRRETDAERLLVVCNFGAAAQPFPLEAETAGMTLLYGAPGGVMPPYDARIYYKGA